jgi:RNA polymerase sigma-70 factor, ECF subfamily
MNPGKQNSTAETGYDRQRDVLLAFAARSGDSRAFVELSDPHVKRVLRTLYRITRNFQDAEDVLQEALMKAFLHIDSYQGKSSFSTWFTRIAVNTALMLLRKRRGVREIAMDNVGALGKWDLKDSRENPEQCFERQQRTDLIRSGILRLPPQLREAVELQHSRDLSTDEIAKCLGISVAATKSRLSRARMALCVSVQREIAKPPANAGPVRTKACISTECRPWHQRSNNERENPEPGWPGHNRAQHGSAQSDET